MVEQSVRLLPADYVNPDGLRTALHGKLMDIGHNGVASDMAEQLTEMLPLLARIAPGGYFNRPLFDQLYPDDVKTDNNTERVERIESLFQRGLDLGLFFEAPPRTETSPKIGYSHYIPDEHWRSLFAMEREDWDRHHNGDEFFKIVRRCVPEPNQ